MTLSYQNPKTAIIGQMKSKEAHLLQLGNILMGCIRVVPVLVGFSATFALLGIGTDIMTMQPADFSFEAMQQMLWVYVLVGGFLGAVYCCVFNKGRFRNIYYERAFAEEDIRRAVCDERQRQIDLVEDVLVKHELITDVQREQKRYQNK